MAPFINTILKLSFLVAPHAVKDSGLSAVTSMFKTGLTGARPTEAPSYIYATPDWKSNSKQLLVLLQGDGAPRAGEWARKVIINDCMDAGSQVPWVRRGVTDKYAVMLLNPNVNSVTVSGKDVPIKGSETSANHVQYVWDNFITKASAKNIFIVAHSSGGSSILELGCQKTKDFLSKVTAVAFTDSNHMVKRNMPKELTKFLYENCKHWVASDHDLDIPIACETYDAPQVSAGDLRHEWTTWSSFNSIFDFFKQMAK